MKNRTAQRKQLQQQLNHATSYEDWYNAAWKLDELDGLLKWREHGDTRMLHQSLIQQHMQAMRRHREQRETAALTRVLQESLYRHMGEFSNPDLYAVARSGTKTVVGEFLLEVERSMQFICDHPIPGVSEEQKLQLFRRAEHVFGNPALMLSGGGAFGIYHLGVTRALWEQDLLPDVIAGSSMGAIIAGNICSRDHEELTQFFRNPHDVHMDALRWLMPNQIRRQGHAMDQTQLLHHIRTNMGSYSFKETFRHSGRTLNISVSPTRTRQKPRLLNELASPDVLIDSAVLASCAVPGLYPAVTLRARDHTSDPGAETPYMPSETWIDGSLQGDLPIMRMARLHNINKTIVSQANPHILPFISHHHERGPWASVRQAAASVTHAHVATVLELTRNSWTSPILRPSLEQAHAMANQSYLGDINIQFPFRPSWYRKVLSNPGPADLDKYIRMGEQATWPRMALVRDQTRISRAFMACIQQLKERAGKERAQVSA
jgi:NTE family protein